MNKKNVFILISLWILFLSSVSAKKVEYDDMLSVAKSFMLNALNRDDDVKSVIPFVKDDLVTMYAANFAKGGFVLVSGSYDADPILGYSLDGEFLPKDSIENDVFFRGL